MTLEIDHVFVLTDPGAPAADALVAAGFAEGSSNTHPGQGTSNRRFFLPGVMVELLWVHDAQEAAAVGTRRMGLGTRAPEGVPHACPVGLCTRGPAAPFPTWDYAPRYLPEGVTIPVSTDSHEPAGPLLFHLPFGGRPDARSEAAAEPIDQPAAELTRVVLAGPAAAAPSPELQALADARLVDLVPADVHRLTLTFDDARAGRAVDLQPDAALVLHW
jgi:hypothetical protein